MVTPVTRRRRAVTLIEILVASIGAFGVLAGLASLYTLALTMYGTAVRQDRRLASAGLVDDLMFQITTTCPTDRWQFHQSTAIGQDGMPQWRALTYERLSNHANRLPSGAIQDPFGPYPGGNYAPRDTTSVMDSETGIVFWWRDFTPSRYHPQQDRYLESKIFHIRLPMTRRSVATAALRNPPFGQAADSFSDLNQPAIEAFVTNIDFRRLCQVLADDVLEFHLQSIVGAVPSDPALGLYWRFDAFRGGS